MFLREGSQLRAKSLGVSCAVLSMACGAYAAESAGRAGPNGPSVGIKLPREILPWRRSIELQAGQLLIAARKSAEAGDVKTAKRRLQNLVDRFPRTHAAADGRIDLAKLRGRQTGTIVPQGLGVLGPAGAARSPGNDGQSLGIMPPVAGWQPTIKPDALNLREALIEAAGDRVFFKRGSIRLNPGAAKVLRNQARWLKKHKHVKVRIVGHADDPGSLQKNMRLSHDRAVAVRKRLIRYGIRPRRLSVFSYGKTSPIAICTINTCAQQNRRVVTEIRALRSTELSVR
jgi:outer membrane protein OmpA-like peptidoglycan-associated protein